MPAPQGDGECQLPYRTRVLPYCFCWRCSRRRTRARTKEADVRARRFWIKYISRDEIELLTKGSNGSEGMRASAMIQPEDSPLYGFIRFRRRNVLVQYIPEGTSRVLKGRNCHPHPLHPPAATAQD